VFGHEELLACEPLCTPCQTGEPLLGPKHHDGILEVITIPRRDELPYVFELQRGQRLSVSTLASANLHLALCTDSAYDCWIDSGMPGLAPDECLVKVWDSPKHSLQFVPPASGAYLVVLVNSSDATVEVVVAATVSAEQHRAATGASEHPFPPANALGPC